jgi:hypothetical protein
MTPTPADRIRSICDFSELIEFLHEEMNWPIASDSLEEVAGLFYSYDPEELGIDAKVAAKIQSIRRLKPLTPKQPWGIFFIEFEDKPLPVAALRRILSAVEIRRRTRNTTHTGPTWHARDLLFIANHGAGETRGITFAHFADPRTEGDLPSLKVLGWNSLDTVARAMDVAQKLTKQLYWPDDTQNLDEWGKRWRSVFTVGHREEITTSKQLALRLAQLARDIRDNIGTALAIETDKGPLKKLLATFRSSLVHDLDEAGFADMYAQTIAYGLLSARIADPTKKSADDLALHMRTSPFLRELMETFLKVGGRKGRSGGPGLDFDELGVSEVTELLDAANMEAVVRDFGDKNRQEDPVMHFFEGFLEAYNKAIRKDRGVFYTPQPVVSYIVRSVHELLQSEFGLADGLADTTTWGEMLKKHPDLKLPPLTDEPGEKRSISPDEPFVQILDPATGTATFLVEVIDVIHRTLAAKWKQQRLTDAQQRAAWNDYVPQHLLPRLHAYELMMAPYAIAHMKVGLKLAETGYRFGTEERARIYLTNALEPWVNQLPLIGFDALAHEAAAVNEIKRHKRFTVVIGNPPYAGISSNMSETAQRMVDAYRLVDGASLNERKLWLQDDYVKFIRKAQTTIDTTKVGVFGYITNHGYLDNPTFRGMRQSLMETFPQLRVLDLHGNANKKEQAPDGSEDKNVFDIRQGVAICLATRGWGMSIIEHADVWGPREAKYDWFSKHSVGNTAFGMLAPHTPFYFFEPQNTDCREEYDAGFKLTEAMPCFGLGFQSSRDHLVVGFDRHELESRIANFIAPQRSDTEVRNEFFPGKVVADYAAGDTRQWSLSEARRVLRADPNWRKHIRPCLYRPFDCRVILYDKRMVDWPRPEVLGHMLHPNLCLLANRQSKEDFAALCTNAIPERKIAAVYDASSSFPLYLHHDGDGLKLSAARQPNFSHGFLKALAEKLGIQQSKPHGLPAGLTPEDIFHYAYAVFHSPGYRSRYAEFLKIDFPRLPLTGILELFRALARLGGELTALHLLESPKLAQPITEFIGSRNPEVEKTSWTRDTVWVDKAQTTGFQGVREDVWNFHIGGYQVCEKWLKDRKGRTLSDEDIAHYHKIVVALSETIRLMAEIDKVIEQYGGWPGAFQTGATAAAEANANTPPVEPELYKESAKQTHSLAAETPKPTEQPPAPRFAPDEVDPMRRIRLVFGEKGAMDRETAIKQLSLAEGHQRAGKLIKERWDNAIRTAVRREVLENDCDSLRLKHRDIDDYTRDELKTQFLASLEGHAWKDRNQSIRDLAHWLGFAKAGPKLDEAVRSVINGLLREDRLEGDQTRVRRRAK